MALDDRDRDDETGQFTVEYPPDVFVEAIVAHGGTVGTKDVEDAVGCSYELAYKKLHQLADDGTIDRQKVGNVNLWVVDDG